MFKKGKEDSGNDAHNRGKLADPENKHPFDEPCFRLCKFFFKTLFYNGDNVFLRLVIGFVQYLNEGVSAFFGEFFSQYFWYGYDGHKKNISY